MRIAVIGSGYVGLVTAACLARLGHRVVCVEKIKSRVDAINAGRTPFFEPGLDAIVAQEVRRGRLRASSEIEEAAAESALTFIAVGTPERRGAIDTRDVEAAAAAIGRGLRRVRSYRIVVVKSTVTPGTTRDKVRVRLERASGRKAGAGFGLCMNPEFTREGRAVLDFLEPDRIVIGAFDRRSAAALEAVYRPFRCPKVRTSLENAELIKYASNTFLATLISFSNELARLCETVPGADVDTVLDGLHKDRRLTPGRRAARLGVLDYLKAGIGFGGNCLPKDANALRAFARSRGARTRMLDAVMNVNSGQADAFVGRVEEAVGSLRNAKVAVLGLAFKPDTDDVRRSPAQAVIRSLARRGACISAFDPVARKASLDPAINGRVRLCATPEEAVRGARAVLIATDWPHFRRLDWRGLLARVRRPVVADGRGTLKDVRWPADVVYLRPGAADGA